MRVFFQSIVLFVLIVPALSSYGQPRIARDTIPPKIPTVVRRQIELLYSNNALTRGEAAFRLGEMGRTAHQAIPYLLALFDDSASLFWEPGHKLTNPAKEAASALVKIGEPSIQPLIDSFKSCKDHDEEELKKFALYKIGRPAVTPLVKALKHTDPKVRASAAITLGRIGDRQAVDSLIELLADKEVRASALYALGGIKDHRAVGPIMEILRSENNVEIRVEGVEALGEIGDSRALDILVILSKDKEQWVRTTAVKSLGRMGGPFAVAALIEALNDEDGIVRDDAVSAIGNVGDKSAVGPLLDYLKKEKSEKKWNHCWNIVDTLKKITGVDFGMDVDKWYQWYQRNSEKTK
jgi:HEAT repeat protein